MPSFGGHAVLFKMSVVDVSTVDDGLYCWGFFIAFTTWNCYGRKNHTIRLGRKEFHINAAISNTTDNILGMDFIHKYKLDFRWNEFGDLFIIDKKAGIKSLLKHYALPHNSAPRIIESDVLSISHDSPQNVFFETECMRSFSEVSREDWFASTVTESICRWQFANRIRSWCQW